MMIDMKSIRPFLPLLLAGVMGGCADGNKSTDKLTETTVDTLHKKMNVLFIAVDDLRPEIGIYGNTQAITPNIDGLASQSVTFDKAYCQQAICMASRASLMSGCRPDSANIYTTIPLRKALPKVITLPQHFKQNGYITVAVGKIYHYNQDDPQGWTKRYIVSTDLVEGYAAGYQDPKHQATMEEYYRFWDGPNRKRRAPASECYDAPEEEYPDCKTTDLAISELRKNAGGSFFLGVGYYRPHLPFVCPQKYWDLYKREQIKIADNPNAPEGAPKQAMHNWGELRQYQDIPRKGPLSDEKARELIHGYLSCVSFVDSQIGRLLDELKRLGLEKNTVVVLWGDHGWNLGEHGLWSKHCNFETATRVPLFVSVPGLAKGHTTNGLVELVDIYPTLCDICGLSQPAHLQGASFLPLLKDTKAAGKKAAFSQFWMGGGMRYSMRTQRYRFTSYISSDESKRAYELYDHEMDSDENKNIANMPKYHELVKQLYKTLKSGHRLGVKY